MLNYEKMFKNYKNESTVEVVEIEGKAYACSKWNGEIYSEVWQLDDDYKYISVEGQIKPIEKWNKELEIGEIIGYEIL